MTEVLEKETTKKYDEKLLELVKKHLANSDVVQSTLAKRISKSPATLSQYLKGEYKGNVENLENDLRKYLKLVNAKKSNKKLKLGFEKTSVATKIIKIALMCQYNGDLAVCYGSSGLGKTTTLEYLKKEYSGIILVDPDENATPRAILKQIADGLKLGFYDLMPEDFMANIVKKLKKSEYLIIVDEAENLKPDVFRTLRKIHDRCKGSCGLLFIGTERLRTNLEKKKGEFDYVLNRVSLKIKLSQLNKGDVKLLVKQIFPDASDEMVDVFSEVTENNARVLFHTIKRSVDIIKENDVELNADVIKEAREMLF